MKKIVSLLSVLAVVATMLSFAACGGDTQGDMTSLKDDITSAMDEATTIDDEISSALDDATTLGEELSEDISEDMSDMTDDSDIPEDTTVAE